MDNLVQELFGFIKASPTSSHTAETVKGMLQKAGFQELKESEPWQLQAGGRYFVTRGTAALAAFKLPRLDFSAFSIAAPHGDSPCFRVKAQPEMPVCGHYTKLDTEVYGGTVLQLWLDRPLSAAGRLAVRTEEGVKTVLADIDRDLLVIPGLAPHIDPAVREGRKLDPQKDTLPLLGGEGARLLPLLAEAVGVKEKDVLSFDLFLYNRASGTVFGAGEEFIGAPRLDDLECAFTGAKAFLAAENPDACTVYALFDNEEIGSLTRRGADSTLLSDLLARICLCAGKNEEQRQQALANSLMLSADNAHALHPNYPEKADPVNKVYPNGGVVVKYSTRYATDAVAAGVFKKICESAGVPVQEYYNNSSTPGGGTLGNISGSHVSVPTVDIGLAQLSMHSPYETAGREDVAHMVNAITAFYSSRIISDGDGCYRVETPVLSSAHAAPVATAQAATSAEAGRAVSSTTSASAQAAPVAAAQMATPAEASRAVSPTASESAHAAPVAAAQTATAAEVSPAVPSAAPASAHAAPVAVAQTATPAESGRTGSFTTAESAHVPPVAAAAVGRAVASTASESAYVAPVAAAQTATAAEAGRAVSSTTAESAQAAPVAAAQTATAAEVSRAVSSTTSASAQAAPAVAAQAVEKESETLENKPGWQNESVFYQIYPMGFCGAPFENDGKTVSRILKVRDWTPHLKKLGVGAVYFSPVFESDTHGYDTRDYRKIDSRLGTNQDFKAVCESLHGAGIRVVLDGVFNHVGRGFWAFQDVLKNRERSAYKDWFHINFGGNSGYNDGLWYEGWEGHYELVKLNLKNPQVVDHLLECVGGWMDEFQIDGLRLDVAYMVDPDFMKRLHRFCRERRPDFFLLGEMIHGDYRRIMNPDMLDSVTNYECYKGLYSSFNDKNMFEIAHSLNRQFGAEGWTLYKGEHLLCFADNHDVTRIHTILKDKKQLPGLYTMLYCMPGIPCLYYGSEWGADGDKKDGDPALRPCFEKPVENELTAFLGQLGAIRRGSRALSDGSYQNETILNKQLVIRREAAGETVLAAINADGGAFSVGCRYSGPATDLFTGEKVSLSGKIELEPYGVKLYRLG